MTTDCPQPRCADSSAARITLTLPMHSKVWSMPQPVSSTSTCWMGFWKSLGLRHSVAPNWRASSNLVGLVSMPMMRPAFASFAPCTTARPMPPRPKTATESPGCTFAVKITAPRPVVTPQPSRHTCSLSASGLIFATDTSATTVYSLKVEQPM